MRPLVIVFQAYPEQPSVPDGFSKAGGYFDLLEDCGDTASYRCICGHLFWVSAAGEDNLVFCEEQRCLMPCCPSCGKTDAKENNTGK